MNRLRGVRYGLEHPSGHLHQWIVPDVLELLRRSDLKIVSYEFARTPYLFSRRKNLPKALVFGAMAVVERLFGTHRASEILVGGSMFILAEPSRQKHAVVGREEAT